MKRTNHSSPEDNTAIRLLFMLQNNIESHECCRQTPWSTKQSALHNEGMSECVQSFSEL